MSAESQAFFAAFADAIREQPAMPSSGLGQLGVERHAGDDPIQSFVILYHRPTGEVSITCFGRDRRLAMSHRFDLEKARPSEDWEVVVLNARSFADVRRTHSRYFSEASPQ